MADDSGLSGRSDDGTEVQTCSDAGDATHEVAKDYSSYGMNRAQ